MTAWMARIAAGVVVFLAVGGSSAAGGPDVSVWVEDVPFLLAQIEEIHPDPYHRHTPEEWRVAVQELEAKLASPDCTVGEAIYGFQRIVAMLGDGHSRIDIPSRLQRGRRWLPIHTQVFSDGLYVRTGHRDHAELFGKRIVSVNGKPVAEVFAALRPFLSSDNGMGALDLFPHYLRNPWALHAAGVTPDVAEQVSIGVETDDGSVAEITVPATTDSWITPEWRDADAHVRLQKPLYRRMDGNYAMEYLAEERVLYVYIESIRDDDGESLAEFSRGIFEFIEGHEVVKLVLDLRENGGGNNYLNQPLVHGLIGCDEIREPGRLFVITGRDTFSAAMGLAVDIEKHTHALFVGEPPGATPNHFGDTRRVVLPRSRLVLRCSELYWQGSDPRDRRPWITPDIPAELSFADFLGRRDPAMEAILAYRHDADAGPESPNRNWFRPSQRVEREAGEPLPGASCLAVVGEIE